MSSLSEGRLLVQAGSVVYMYSKARNSARQTTSCKRMEHHPESKDNKEKARGGEDFRSLLPNKEAERENNVNLEMPAGLAIINCSSSSLAWY